MSIRFDRKKLYLWILIQWIIVGGCILAAKMLAASEAGVSLSEYVRSTGLSPSLYALAAVLLAFDGIIISGVREYEIDENGITFKKALGKPRTVLWSETAFVGPAWAGNGRFRHKSIFYSNVLPRPCSGNGEKYLLDGKNAFELQDSAAMRSALKRYCPVYTEKYEDMT